ncbi:MAG: GGDEF domain-containing protein [Acidobacteriota bacterium]|nr:GGDEF domain-containing protein [Acidobacteriota bacterium]
MELQAEEVLQSALKSYGDVFVAVGQAGAQACPPVGNELKESLLNLRKRLNAEASASAIVETEQLLEAELQTWSARVSHFLQGKTEEVREILQIVAKATRQLGERDQLNSKEFGKLTERLQATAKLNDLSTIRQALVKNVAEMEICVSKMTLDGQESLGALRAQMSIYEARLEEVERIASQDPLTGLANRRKLERQLQLLVSLARPFSVIFIDLNGFKNINDTYGHQAGDDLLKQFAGELRTAFRATDTVGRWGGDEFVVLVDADFHGATSMVQRIQKWVDGEYSVLAEAGPRKIQISAASGVASWRPGDSPTAILQRADAAMYQHKVRIKVAER